MSIADDLVAAHEPWLTPDLEVYLREIGAMFAEVELYSDDTEDYEGWTILLDVDRAPEAALPFLAQFVGERLPVGLSDAAKRQWIRDAPNQRRGTIRSIVSAAARYLEGEHPLVTIIERDGGPDKLSVITYYSQSGVRVNLITHPKAGDGTTAGWTNVGLATLDTANFPGPGGLPSGITTAYRLIADSDNDRAYHEFPVEDGKVYTASVYMRIAQLGSGIGIRLRVTDDTGTEKALSAEGILTTVEGPFVRQHVTFTADETSPAWRLSVRASGVAPYDLHAHYTAAMVEEGNQLRSYHDGDLPDSEWLGTTNASESRYSNKAKVLRELETVVPADISLTYTLSPGQTWAQVLVDNVDWNEVATNYPTWADLGAATPEGTYTR